MQQADKKQAILVVSFGTTHNDTREKTIDAIESGIGNAYPDYAVYRAWTSQMIIRRLQLRDGIVIPTILQAMEAMRRDGVEDIIVQPTHVINGRENDEMKEIIQRFLPDFRSIRFGTPLLTSDEDMDCMVQTIAELYKDLSTNEALILLGHGTEHYANAVYAALDYRFKEKGHENIFVGTVEAYPGIDVVKRKIAAYQPKKIHMAPLLIVAGDHAKKDLAGPESSSWASQFKLDGYPVECTLKGLGEYQSVRDQLVRHVASAQHIR